MKNLKMLSLALCLACTPVNIYAAAAGESPIGVEEQAVAYQRIFGAVDVELARLSPGTLKGFAVVDDDLIVPIAQHFGWKNDDTWQLASPEAVHALRFYFFNKFFAFMDGLRIKKPTEVATGEFNALFQNIYAEAAEAKAGKLSDINWHFVQIMLMRGLLLASGEGSEEAQDLLSNVPDTELFFGALRETPEYLRDERGNIPAWKHSTKACLHNMGLDDTKGNDIKKPYLIINGIDWDVVDLVKKQAKLRGLPENVYLPMVGLGKIGITTIVKMWLNHVFPVPLTYGEYTAHAIQLGSAVGAQHDMAHGDVDNRRREVRQAILNLLNKALEAKKPVRKAIPLATKHMVERYKALNEVLLAFIEAKERTAITELEAAIALAPTDKNNAERKEAEKLARQKYNTGVAALFQVLHEEYAMKANVMEAPTFAEAIAKLCENAKTVHEESTSKFDELDTFFNPRSDLTDMEIFEKIKGRTLASLRIYPVYDSSKPTPPTTIGEYTDHIDMESLEVIRGPVITEVRFDTLNGKRAKVQTVTSHYAVNTVRDENAVLGLVGKKVPDLTLDLAGLRELPKDASQRAEALTQVKAWVDAVVANTNEMVMGLVADTAEHTPADLVARYNKLVATQNAEWLAAYPPAPAAVVVSDPSAIASSSAATA